MNQSQTLITKYIWLIGAILSGCANSNKVIAPDEPNIFDKHVYFDLTQNNWIVTNSGDSLDVQILVNGTTQTTHLTYDNLRFLNIQVRNGRRSKTTFLFQIDSVYFSYGSTSISTKNGLLSSNDMKAFFDHKPKVITIDSIAALGSNGTKFHFKTKHILNVYYPENDLYTCIDIGNSIRFFALLKSQKTENITIELSDYKGCNIINFHGDYGSQSFLLVKNDAGETVYSRQFSAGKNHSIHDYLIVPILGLYDIEIRGDLQWKGKILFTD